jgi:hypothetical protein
VLRITNIAITPAAHRILREERACFEPRREGDVFGLVYMFMFTDPDGTPVAGFRPGYSVESVSPVDEGDHWAMAQLIDGPDFVFLPRFEWNPTEQYIVDVASSAFRLFSIVPAG